MGLYDDVYAAFEAAAVRYVVVGGIAVVLSGHVRATVDLDVVVDLAPDAAARAMQALADLGLRPRVPVEPRDLADPEVREGWIRNKHMQVLSFFDPQHAVREVDVFVAYPMDFELLVARARADLGGWAPRPRRRQGAPRRDEAGRRSTSGPRRRPGPAAVDRCRAPA